MAMVEGVYDRPAQGSLFPYITLGDSSGSDYSTKNTTGTEQIVTLQIWSREGGRKEAATIMELIYQLLHQGSLSVTGQILSMIRFVASEISVENDGWTYKGVMRFRALLQSAS
jgi:hypothetical protein